ncbi:hypothetical protein FGO68_gene9578 [Halteria grandinella]|uniref:Uncharacterized protein n=1 Tax=Halteria grandinella TaxID=5974 RepID=A0A8J8NHS6_HALGN|nr:hypothetical protein FGO68_gene9578 [Halteria grandinella]
MCLKHYLILFIHLFINPLKTMRSLFIFQFVTKLSQSLRKLLSLLLLLPLIQQAIDTQDLYLDHICQ